MPDDPAQSFSQMNQAAKSDAQKKPADDPVQPCPLSKKVRVRIVAKDEGFAVYKDARYRLEVEFDNFEGNTGTSGIIDHKIPAISNTAKLTVWPKGGGEPIVFDFVIEAIDPIDLESGVEARLKNLGLDGLEDFQSTFELEPSEQLTSEGKARLQEVFSEKEQAAKGPDWAGLPDKLADLYKRSS